ncbi:telomere length regulation protein-domain-containing protein [Zychaea mexicana]|uniref:telomere length regulation protein-domain-containing protein n=1 Tax=Zychaea mexicana TaxID=64656 RepID=UPI0022FDFB53|nr:telomere length regulation protein-domain-containing protein [Zychaea mexicana]KAI9492648.1 telomere length regulation protein-domain-containing protein [Zychaea mexicana]
MNEQLRALDDATLPDNNPELDAIRACLEQPLEWAQPVKPVAWKHHVRTIAQTVIPNWAYALNSKSNNNNLALRRTILREPKVSLPILLDSLRHSSVMALDLYIDLLKYLTDDPMVYGDDRFFSNLLCSVPTRIANALGLGGSDSWYFDKNYYARLARHVARNNDTAMHQRQKYQTYAGEILGKIIRLGHADVCIAAVYPIALEQEGKGWPHIWALAESHSSGTGKITETVLRLVQQKQQQDGASLQKAASQLATILFATDGKSDRVDKFLSHAYIRIANASWTDATTLKIAMTTAIYAVERSSQGLDETNLSPGSFSTVDSLVRRLIDKWTDPVFLKHGSYKEQEYTTAGLVYALGHLSKNQIETIMYETALRGVIDRWFESSDPIKMKLAVVLAESLSELTEEITSRLNFGILDEHDDTKYLDMKMLARKRDALNKESGDGMTCDDGNGPILEEYDSPSSSDHEQEDEEFDPDAIMTGDQEDSEDDNDRESDLEPYPMEEESDDDEALQGSSVAAARKKRVKAPVYILDLIAYLKDDEDSVKLDVGLSTAERLVRDKTDAGSELTESAVELAKRLIGFPKAYYLDNTTERQKHALAALVAAAPKTVAGYMIDQIFDRNISLEQKQTILASIILGVRELAGTRTDPVGHDELSEELEKRLAIQEAGDDAKAAAISTATTVIGKPRVFSRRMDIEKNKRTQRNRLSGLAGPVFFFPLLVGWWEGARGKAKSWMGRDALLAERFVMTLLVIMHGATNTPDRGRIVTEYFEFALPLRFLKLPRPVIRGALLGFDIIVNVNYAHQGTLLLQEYPQQLAETKHWLEEIMEMMNADDLNRIALRILARLMEISMSA